jgi:repressor LexA
MTKYTLSEKETELVKHIRNSIMRRGYAPSVRELMAYMHYKSPRSTAEMVKKLIEKKVLTRKVDGDISIASNFEEDESRESTIDVALVGSVAAGMPILAEENIFEMIPVSTKLARPPHRYYLLRVKGDSMNLAGINDGDLVLVRQQQEANEGDIVVALINGEATIKEFHKSGNSIILKPKSKNKTHKPIILTSDFLVQGTVVTAIKGL